VLRIAAGQAAALDGALSLFEDYVQRGDSAAVLLHLRSLSDSNFGHCAVAMIAWAPVDRRAGGGRMIRAGSEVVP
jgi:hypothetical protein